MDGSAARSPRREQRMLLLTLSPFGLFGIVFGVWLVLLAKLQAAFSLSPAMLGAALATGLVAALPVMVLCGRAVDRWSAGVVVAGSAGLIALAFVGVAFAPSYVLLVPFFLLFYSATAAYEIGINAAAIGFEQASGRQVMGYFHAAFSGFAASSALVVGGLLSLGVPFHLLYLVGALLAVGLALVVGHSRRSLPESSPPPASRGAAPTRKLYRRPIVVLLAAVTALAFLSEGEMGNWVTIYLRSVLELPILLGASGFVVFHSAMFVGRLIGARTTRRWGRWHLLTTAGAVVTVGMLLALASEQAPLILGGFLLVGLGLSVIAPTAYSLVGDAAGNQAGAASAVLTTVGYSGYLFGPVLVGGIAEFAGLRVALATIVAAGAGIVLLSSVARLGVPSTFPNMSPSLSGPSEVADVGLEG